MWNSIVSNIISSVGVAAFTKFIDKSKSEKFEERIERTVLSLFEEFANTTLDCNDFNNLICSSTFIEMLRIYYYTLNDKMSNEEYFNKFEVFISSKVQQCSKIEIRRFLKKCEELYTSYLGKILEENIELCALFQLLTIANRELIGKVIKSEEDLLKYIKKVENQAVVINDKDIKSYHSICKNEFGVIKFTGISGVESKDQQELRDFYVDNTFSYYSREIAENYEFKDSFLQNIDKGCFFDYCNKVIIIGGAGLGKSTTLNYLFCNYESIYNTEALKIKIDLKDYVKEIVEDKKNILSCLANEFSKRISKTNYEYADIEKNISRYLDEGKCFIILDALDEIPTQSSRNKVRDEIANFSRVYFLNRFIISTREVGYLKNKFDDSFLHIKINQFNDEQLKKYSENWCRFNHQSKSFDEFWSKFNQEVTTSKCREIIRNPIVLILALVIFDIEKNLPNSRVEFYKKCIDTFLEVRENRKAAFDIDRDMKNILGDDSIIPKVSHYKFLKIKDDLGYVFTLEEIKKSIMLAIEVKDSRNWILPVDNFTKYLVDRTELIKEIDEDKYEFAHKTFYEYFLAVYFSKELDHSELMELLKEWVGDSNYDELVRLIIEVIIYKNDSAQHKVLITSIFNELNKVEQLQRKFDYFSIVLDLYRNGQLLVKFHGLYNDFILYNAHLVNSKRNKLINKINNSDEMYSSNILADRFTEIVIKDESQMSLMIESLYHLDNRFKNRVIELNGSEYQYIVDLFRWVANIRKSEKKKNKNITGAIEYFKSEGNEMLLKHASIYLAYVSAIVSCNNYVIDESLFNYSFLPTNIFYNYTKPSVLKTLIDKAFESWGDFLLLLICIIQCGKSNSNFILSYVVRSRHVRDNGKENITTYSKVREIWELLNKTINYAEFQNVLENKNLYNLHYSRVYEQLYNDYQTREKRIYEFNENGILDIIKSYNSVN